TTGVLGTAGATGASSSAAVSGTIGVSDTAVIFCWFMASASAGITSGTISGIPDISILSGSTAAAEATVPAISVTKDISVSAPADPARSEAAGCPSGAVYIVIPVSAIQKSSTVSNIFTVLCTPSQPAVRHSS